MTPRTTFVSFLLDETGSMQSIKDDTIGGFNAYVDRLRKDGEGILFSLVSFNSSETRRRYVAEPIGNVRPLGEDEYAPRDSTPLIDAAVKLIDATAEAVGARDDDPNVVVVMQTDGRENVSVEYTNADLALRVKKKRAAGWEFVFLGAGLDAFDAARRAGLDLDARQVMSYDRGLSRVMFDAVGENVSAYSKTGSAASLRFTDEQREDAGDEHTRRHLGGAARPKRGRRSSRSREKRARSTADDYDLS